MKRKLPLFLGSLLILSLAFGTSSFSKSQPWKKIMDRPVNQIKVDDNEVIIEFDTLLKERQSGETLNHPYTAFDNDITLDEVNRLGDSHRKEFTVKVKNTELRLAVDENDNVLQISDPKTESVYITQTRDKQLISFNLHNDLYVMDVNTGQSKKVSSDHVGGYDRNQLIEHAQKRNLALQDDDVDDYPTPLTWVYASLMNKEGTYIIYESNRRGYLEDKPHNDIWLKDLNSDEEKIVVEDALIVDWLNDDTIAFKRGSHEAGTHHIPSGLTKTAEITDGFFGITEKYAVYATANSVVTVNLDTHEKREIKLPEATTVFNGIVDQNRNQAAVFYYQGSHSSAWIAVIDLEFAEVNRTLSPPALGNIEFDHNGKIILWSYEKEQTWIEE
jgi:hypothetical protein